MRPRFQADADFNHKAILGLRRRESAIDFQDAHAGRVIGLPDDRRNMPGYFAQFLANRTSPGLILVDQDLG